MSYGRFMGGKHFSYLKKGITFEKATTKQKEILKSLGIEIESNLTKIRATYLIKQNRELRDR